MKKQLLLLSLTLTAICANAQTRFVDNVLNRSQITETLNVTYAQNYTVLYGDIDTSKPGPQFMLESLNMDIYAPNDGSKNRPLIVYLHTGSFLPRYINNSPVGAKDDSATVEMCRQFAQKGYVVASITYRKGWNPTSQDENVRRSTIINAAYKGVQDLSSCIRWFKSNVASFGNTFDIDTNKICAGGQGTGSYITSAFASIDKQSEIKIPKFRDPATGAVFVNDTIWGNRFGFGGYPGFNNSNNTPGHTSNAQVAFAIGGALGDSSWMEAGEIPLIWSHSVYDPFAPYTTGMVNVPGTTLQVVEVSGGHDVMARCQRLGNTAPYKGKVMDDYTRAANVFNEGIDGLYPIVGMINASGPYEWWDTNKIKMLPPQYYNVPVILGGAKAANPYMGKSRAMLHIDTLQHFLAPRIAVTLGLVASVGVEDKNLGSNVTIAPNPTKNHLVIHNNWENNQLRTAQIFDMNGRMVQKLVVTGNHNVYNLNLPTGLYVVQMQFDNGTGTKKLIIE